MKGKNAALRGALLLTGVSLFSQILGFMYRVWLARLIGAEAIGLYQLVMPAYSIIMSLCVSGFTVAVSRLTASYAALGRTRAIRQAVNTARVAYLAMILCAAVLIIPFSDGISVALLGDARCRLGLLLLLPCILLTGWENVHKNYFYGRKNVIPPAISEVLEQIIRTALILGLLFFLRPIYEETQVGMIILGMIISEIVSACLLSFLYRRDRKKIGDAGDLEPAIRNAVRKIAVPVAAANLLTNLIGSVNSIIIPGRLIVSGVDQSEALSAFGVAFGMTMPLLSLPLAFTGSVGLVMLPRLAESAAVKNFAAIRRRLRSGILAAGAAIAVCTAILIPYGAPIARSLFRNPNAGQYMIPLAIATVFVGFESLLGAFLNGLGKQKNTAANYIFAGIVQLVLTYWGVSRPELRLGGFVLAYLVSNMLGTALCGWDLWQLTAKGKQLAADPRRPNLPN